MVQQELKGAVSTLKVKLQHIFKNHITGKERTPFVSTDREVVKQPLSTERE